jgi:hypothetical protein
MCVRWTSYARPIASSTASVRAGRNVQRSLVALSDRIADASRRTNLLGSRVEALELIAKSLERRENRHADHLASLESRVKKLSRDE